MKYIKRWLHLLCPDRVALHDTTVSALKIVSQWFLLFWRSSYSQDGLDPGLDRIWWLDDDICPNRLFSLGTSELGKENILLISVFLLAFEKYRSCKRTNWTLCFFLSKAKQKNDVTFDFFGCFDILCVPLNGADQSVDVRQVHLTADKVLQTLQVVLGFPAWPRLQMMNLCFKGLGKYSQHRESEVSVKE